MNANLTQNIGDILSTRADIRPPASARPPPLDAYNEAFSSRLDESVSNLSMEKRAEKYSWLA